MQATFLSRHAAVLCCAALTTSAHAQDVSRTEVGLDWQAPAEAQCTAAEAMHAKVARLSDVPVTLGQGASGYRVEARVSAVQDTWQAHVRMLDARARELRVRTVQGRTPSCGSIDVAAAVVIATMLDSIRLDHSPAPVTPSSSADGGGPSLAAFGAASPELIPAAWLGGGLAVETRAVMQLAFSGSAYAPAEQTDALGRGARVWGFHAGAALCPAAVRSNFLDLRLCAGAQAGAVSARGIGLTRNTAALVPLALLHAGPKLTLQLSRAFALQLAASAAWVLARPRIVWSVEGEPASAVQGGRIALLSQIGITISPW